MGFMSVLTALLYGALIVYLGGWLKDQWIGNFSLLLFILTGVTFLYWLAERFVFLPKRQAAALALEQQEAARRQQLQKQGISQIDSNLDEAKQKVLAQPWWLDWTAGLFPVIAIVFCLRSFLFEPFKIPTGSMLPTLEVGDLILVNKFDYGIRMPVFNQKLIPIGDPQRGDVVVFRYPPDPRLDYIKRVIGLPGDEVSYLNKVLSINGKTVATEPLPEYYNEERQKLTQQFREDLQPKPHRILHMPERGPFITAAAEFPQSQSCRYSAEGVVCKVPPGHYFVMGDNRDDSVDSRYWGFVPDRNLVGRAFVVWMNFGNFAGRVGTFK
jgi:signal peptidase I